MVQKKRGLTPAERQAKWRLAHGNIPQIKPIKYSTGASPPSLLPQSIPHGGVEIASLEVSTAASMSLYDRLIGLISCWLAKLEEDPDKISPADGLKALALLPAALESLVTLRGKIAEQRVAEANDVKK